MATAIGLFGLPPVSDPTGTIWHASSIAITSILKSFLLMGAFALLAWTRSSGYAGTYDNAHT
ncbi:MAG TPA: hypothetical protein VFT65_15970 [Candidatus Angelobacter sp.]|nr:hypothetical protein [Candidatus Angelobacter sp.]